MRLLGRYPDKPRHCLSGETAKILERVDMYQLYCHLPCDGEDMTHTGSKFGRRISPFPFVFKFHDHIVFVKVYHHERPSHLVVVINMLRTGNANRRQETYLLAAEDARCIFLFLLIHKPVGLTRAMG